MRNVNYKSQVAALIALTVALVALPASGAAAVESDAADVVEVSTDGLSDEELALYRSDAPKTVKVNEQGVLVSVTEGAPIRTMAVSRNCSGDRACWYGQVPTVSYGFNGSGGSGEWSHRLSFHSNNYEARVCWKKGSGSLYPEYCLPYDERLRKNTSIDFGSVVWGTKVILTR